MNEAIQNQPNPTGCNDNPNIVDLVIEDLKIRSEVGLKKYGQKLKPFNGRAALIDAYQESLDLAQYIKQKIVEDDRCCMIKDLKSENPFCNACKEDYCAISIEGHCGMIRKYLEVVK